MAKHPTSRGMFGPHAAANSHGFHPGGRVGGGVNSGSAGQISNTKGANPMAPKLSAPNSAFGAKNMSPTAGNSGVSGSRSMAPMMPMGAGAGVGDRRAGKVKTVTSAVEEEANILALLGDRGSVVPGVIGEWVRG